MLHRFDVKTFFCLKRGKPSSTISVSFLTAKKKDKKKVFILNLNDIEAYP